MCIGCSAARCGRTRGTTDAPAAGAGTRVRAGAAVARRGGHRPGAAPGRAGVMPEGLRRVLWFVGLWAAGVLAVGTVGLLIRWALRGAG